MNTTKPYWLKLVAGIAFSAAFLGAVEAALRLSGFSHKPREHLLSKPTVAGFHGTFEFYIPTLFSPPEYLWLSQPNTPYTDERGFRKPSVADVKPAGIVRVAFLGGSTTHGGYRPYPQRAVEILNAAAGALRFEQLNAACSSYTSHQSKQVLRRYVLPLQPDAVVLYDGWNDLRFSSDGYSDASKDSYMPKHSAPEGSDSWLAYVGKARLTQAVGLVVDAADTSWPQPRCTPEVFESNLRQMATMCVESGAKPYVLTRSNSRRKNLSPVPPEMITYYGKRFGLTDQTNIYNRVHQECMSIQSNVCADGTATLIDGNTSILNAQDQMERGEFGPKVQIYRSDDLHLFDIGDQILAEDVARGLAPAHGLSDAVNRYLASPEYALRCASVMLEDVAAREALYYARLATKRGAEAGSVRPVELAAQGMVEFQDAFLSGRWGGSDESFEAAMKSLRRCLEINPSDTGVALQVIRRCLYMGQSNGAAEVLDLYRPRTPQERDYIVASAAAISTRMQK